MSRWTITPKPPSAKELRKAGAWVEGPGFAEHNPPTDGRGEVARAYASQRRRLDWTRRHGTPTEIEREQARMVEKFFEEPVEHGPGY